MQTIGHAPGVVAQWAGEPPVRDQPHHTHAAGGGREQYGGAGVQNTGIMEIKSHPCSSADPRHIELSGRLIHARDSRQPTLSGIKVAACDEQLGLTSSRCGSTLQDHIGSQLPRVLFWALFWGKELFWALFWVL